MTVGRHSPPSEARSPLKGIGVCPGRAAGPVALMVPRPRLPAEHPDIVDAEAEVAAAIAALSATAEDLERRAAGTAIPGAAEVLEATAMIARDPSLEEAIRSAIAKGEPAPGRSTGPSMPSGRCSSISAATWPSGSGPR